MEAVIVIHVLQRHTEPGRSNIGAVRDVWEIERRVSTPARECLRFRFNGAAVTRKSLNSSAMSEIYSEGVVVPLLRLRRRSRGVSRWTLPLLRRLFPGVRAAFALSLSALIACGVVGAALRADIGRVAGPPRGVLAAVPGVRKVGVRPAGVGPALIARRKGVAGSLRAVAFGVAAVSGDRRCFLRADSDDMAVRL